MGYQNMNDQFSFVVRSYESKENFSFAMDLGDSSDLVIIGSASEIFIRERLDKNKITFRYSERFLKTGIFSIFDPHILKALYINDIRYRKKNLYLLCASAYAAGDFFLANCYKQKTYKWGYFPKVIHYDAIELFRRKKENPKPLILWAGRFIDLKHPEKAVLVAEKLKKDNFDFEMLLIGEGDKYKEIKLMINLKNLSSHVKMLGFMEPDKVRKYMEKADIFLFTSDHKEGWGAVLNEAMNSGCAVVASHAIGSVPFLITHAYNGLIYRNDDFKDLYQNVKSIMDDENYRYQLGVNAFATMSQTWNAEKATENLNCLYLSLTGANVQEVAHGPCSRAKPIMQWQMYSKCRN